MNFVKLFSLISVITICAIGASCGSSSTTSNAPSSANAANDNQAASKTTQPSYTAPGSSPTVTIKAWRDALRKRDADAFVNTYAQADVDLMKEKAKEDG